MDQSRRWPSDSLQGWILLCVLVPTTSWHPCLGRMPLSHCWPGNYKSVRPAIQGSRQACLVAEQLWLLYMCFILKWA